MTTSVAPLHRSVGEVVIPAVASLTWLGVAALLVWGVTAPGVLAAPVLLAVAATAVAIVTFARRRSTGKPSGALVSALLAPAIALAAMTPLFAVSGVLVFAVFAVIVAIEMGALSVVAARSRIRG